MWFGVVVRWCVGVLSDSLEDLTSLSRATLVNNVAQFAQFAQVWYWALFSFGLYFNRLKG